MFGTLDGITSANEMLISSSVLSGAVSSYDRLVSDSASSHGDSQRLGRRFV